MPIHQTARQLLGQLKEVVSQLTSEQYSTPLQVLSHATIGQHARHTIEFFMSLMDASKDGLINYDNRKHDKYIESDPRLAASVIESISNFLIQERGNFGMEMHAAYDFEGAESLIIKTNFERELVYNIEHAIHHMALMKIGIKTLLPNFELPENFGVASSTVRHRRIHH